MRKVALSIAVILMVTCVQAQNKISEGTIVYTVEWQLPEQFRAIANNFPSEIKVYFKGDSSSTKTESNLYSSTSIMNSLTNFEQVLLDIPLMNKKYSVIFTPEDQKNMADKMPDLKLIQEAETKILAGYKVQKYTGIEKKSGQKFEAWLTKDVEITANAISRFYDKNYGFPVQFTAFLNGLTLKALVKEIKIGTVPPRSFIASKDYEEITVDQLIQVSSEN